MNFPERCGGGDGDGGGGGDGVDDVAGGGGGGAAAAARRARRGNTSSRYSGAEFEAGRQLNIASADIPLPPGGGDEHQESSPRSRERAGSEPRGPRAPEGAKRPAQEVGATPANRPAQKEVCQMQKELDALALLPWLGQTARQDKVGQIITAQFEHKIVPDQPRLIDGAVITEYKIKWRTKSEPERMFKTMSSKGFNQSRMGEYIFLHCKHTPDAIKLMIAKMMRSKAAKKYVAQVTANEEVAADVATCAADAQRKML